MIPDYLLLPKCWNSGTMLYLEPLETVIESSWLSD